MKKPLIASVAAMALGSAMLIGQAAHAATGGSNQRQILIGTFTFENDFGHLPYPVRGVSGSSGGSINQSQFIRNWTGNYNDWPDPTSQQRLYADELVDYGYGNVDMFVDPGNPMQVSSPNGFAPWDQHPTMPDDMYPVAYYVNIFFLHSSLNEQRGYGNPLWRPGNSGVAYNNLTSNVFSSPGENMWIGDKGFMDSPSHVNTPQWDEGLRSESKLFGFADGHVERLPQEAWWVTNGNFWGGFNPQAQLAAEPDFRPRMWDVLHANPQGGNNNWQNMDRAHFP